MDDSSSLPPTNERIAVLKKHDKYVSSISWIYIDDDDIAQENKSCTSWLATSSADGTIHIYTVTATTTGMDEQVHRPPSTSVSKGVALTIQHMESFYFDHPVTCICYAKDLVNNNGIVLYAYVRNTPHIKVIRMPSFFTTPMTTNAENGACSISTVLHLNTSIYDTHVSFAVLDIKMSYDYKYLAVACDNHCHFIIENKCNIESQPGGRRTGTSQMNPNTPPSVQTANVLRKLYGHVADSYSRPIVAWSCNNQYIYCNTQNDTKLCIYSIASGKLVMQNDNEDDDVHHRTAATNSDISTKEEPPPPPPHVRPIKHLCSHPYQNILVTTSFDHKTIVWTAQEPKVEEEVY
jgi:WD40 repeat protein